MKNSPDALRSACRKSAFGLLLCLLLGPFLPAHAQELMEKPVVRVGLKLGASLTNMNFNKGYPKPTPEVETQWLPGVVVGGLLQVPVHNRLSWQQEYVFSLLRSKRNDTGAQYSMSYISLPALLHYRVASRIGLLLGPQFDLLIKAQEKVGGATTDITHDTEERSIGLAAGAEVFLTRSLSLQVRYTQGLNHVGLGQRSNVQEFKYEAVQLAAAFRF